MNTSCIWKSRKEWFLCKRQRKGSINRYYCVKQITKRREMWCSTRTRRGGKEQIIQERVLIRCIREMSREIYSLTETLGNREIEYLNSGNISNVRMLKPLDEVMSINNNKHKQMFAYYCRERVRAILYYQKCCLI